MRRSPRGIGPDRQEDGVPACPLIDGNHFTYPFHCSCMVWRKWAAQYVWSAIVEVAGTGHSGQWHGWGVERCPKRRGCCFAEDHCGLRAESLLLVMW
jgi:hypothetical protein